VTSEKTSSMTSTKSKQIDKTSLQKKSTATPCLLRGSWDTGTRSLVRQACDKIERLMAEMRVVGSKPQLPTVLADISTLSVPQPGLDAESNTHTHFLAPNGRSQASTQPVRHPLVERYVDLKSRCEKSLGEQSGVFVAEGQWLAVPFANHAIPLVTCSQGCAPLLVVDPHRAHAPATAP
jgi:hypothetical protein